MPNDEVVEAIISAAWHAREAKAGAIDRREWIDRLEPLEPVQVARVISGLAGGRIMDPTSPAHMEAASALVQAKLTDRMVTKLDELDQSAGRLATVGLWLTGAGVFLGVVQIAIAIFK